MRIMGGSAPGAGIDGVENRLFFSPGGRSPGALAEGMRGLSPRIAPAETAPSSAPPSACPLLPQGEKKRIVVSNE